MTAHTHTTIVPGCFRCDLNLDEAEETNLHAHVHQDSTDCDGRMERTSTYTPDPGEDDDDFRDRVIALRLPFPWLFAQNPDGIEVTFRESGFSWSARTDEGHTSFDVTWCTTPECPDMKPTQRDHAAEAAGY